MWLEQLDKARARLQELPQSYTDYARKVYAIYQAQETSWENDGSRHSDTSLRRNARTKLDLRAEQGLKILGQSIFDDAEVLDEQIRNSTDRRDLYPEVDRFIFQLLVAKAFSNTQTPLRFTNVNVELDANQNTDLSNTFAQNRLTVVVSNPSNPASVLTFSSTLPRLKDMFYAAYDDTESMGDFSTLIKNGQPVYVETPASRTATTMRELIAIFQRLQESDATEAPALRAIRDDYILRILKMWNKFNVASQPSPISLTRLVNPTNQHLNCLRITVDDAAIEKQLVYVIPYPVKHSEFYTANYTDKFRSMLGGNLPSQEMPDINNRR